MHSICFLFWSIQIRYLLYPLSLVLMLGSAVYGSVQNKPEDDNDPMWQGALSEKNKADIAFLTQELLELRTAEAYKNPDPAPIRQRFSKVLKDYAKFLDLRNSAPDTPKYNYASAPTASLDLANLESAYRGRLEALFKLLGDDAKKELQEIDKLTRAFRSTLHVDNEGYEPMSADQYMKDQFPKLKEHLGAKGEKAFTDTAMTASTDARMHHYLSKDILSPKSKYDDLTSLLHEFLARTTKLNPDANGAYKDAEIAMAFAEAVKRDLEHMGRQLNRHFMNLKKPADIHRVEEQNKKTPVGFARVIEAAKADAAKKASAAKEPQKQEVKQ